MTIQSALKPNNYRIRKKENTYAYILLRDSVTETVNEEGDTLYNYEEYEIVIADRNNLESYIEKNLSVLLDMAKERYRQNEREKVKQELEQIDKEYHTDRAVREFILNNFDKFSRGGYKRAREAEEKAKKLRSKL